MFLERMKTVKESLTKRTKVVDLALSADLLNLWYQTEFGHYIKERELRVIADRFSQLPGYRLLRLGITSDPDSLECFSQLHRFSLHPSEGNGSHAALCDFIELPIPSGVIDVILMQHVLEFSVAPKAVLSEASRVIMPGGHLLLFVFNPFGVHGVVKFPLQLFGQKAQYRFHSLRLGRVMDWLSLLSFEALGIYHVAHGAFGRFSKSTGGVSRWEHWCQKVNLPFGNVYVIHGVKRETQVINQKTNNWQKQTHGYARPTGHGARLENIRQN